QFLSVLASNELDASKSITCPKCGQSPGQTELLPIEASQWSVAELASLTCLHVNVFRGLSGKRLPIYCMIDGISPFLCNLLSHIFTYYDVDPKTQDVQRLTEIDDCTEIFDVSSNLCRSAFQIYNTKLAKMSGYGRNAEAYEYLSPTINYIAHSTASSKDLLDVVEVYGHGSRLYQALSKVLTGCEIYWHALQENLIKHLENFRYIYSEKYPALLTEENWLRVLRQCDLENMQSDTEYGMKLHIQAMCNLLRRPIVLLDRLKYIKVKQSTIILFLPMISPVLCRHEVTLKKNSPLIIGWSSGEYKSFVPVVSYAIEASLSNSILNVWNGGEDLKPKYLEFDLNNLQCKVANGVPPPGLHHKIMLMERIFKVLHNVDPKLVCEYCQDIWYQSSFPNNSIRAILKDCIWRANHGQLWRCLLCRKLGLATPIGKKFLIEGGLIYDYIVAGEKKLRPVGVKIDDVQLWRTLTFCIDEPNMDWKIFIEYESNAFAALFKEKSVSQSAETTSEEAKEGFRTG
uniref:OTU domain-containing protein n=1 Tax=Romanomermis culicivorax TaxID=13658 RepID=A0A915HXD7_ROMCU